MKFEQGDRVVVTKNHYVSQDVCMARGTVVCYYKDKVAIELDDHVNHASSKGVFYFRESQLKSEELEEITMEGMKSVVHVQFISGASSGTYAYACFDEDIKVNDTVVCKSANHGLGIATVVTMDPPVDKFFKREIVCKVNMESYLARVQERERKAELKQKMDKRVKALQSMAIYEMLAKEDDTLKELLEEYKGI